MDNKVHKASEAEDDVTSYMEQYDNNDNTFSHSIDAVKGSTEKELLNIHRVVTQLLIDMYEKEKLLINQQDLLKTFVRKLYKIFNEVVKLESCSGQYVRNKSVRS